MNFTWKKNDQTGSLEASFSCKLKSVSDVTFENKNGTPYRVCVVEFIGADKKDHTVSALMYETNFEHGVEIGNEYLARAIRDLKRTDNNILITVSHLAGSGQRASVDMFGGIKAISENVVEAEKEEAEEYAKKK